MQWILIALGVLLAVVAVFALQNSEIVTIRFLNLETEASVLVVILLSFAAGVFAGVLALLPSSVRKAARIRKLGGELKAVNRREEKLSSQLSALQGPSDEGTETPASAAGSDPGGRSGHPDRV
jgi:uncharacterized integral membrane protein